MSDDILSRDAEYYIDLNKDNYPYYYGRTGECNKYRNMIFSSIETDLVCGHIKSIDPKHIRVSMRDGDRWHYHPDELTKLTHEEAEAMIVLDELQ